MELNFLGRGSAFNPKEGNTSAYFIEDNTLFLIDCGESVFNKLIENNIIDSIDSINLMITHTHSDHVGCLGTLTLYSYFELNKPINIIIKNDKKQINDIKNVIKGFGIRNGMYNFVDEIVLDKKYSSFFNIRYIKTNHYDGLNCYSIVFNTDNGLIFYSGDTNEITHINAIINGEINIDKIYVDVSSSNFKGNPHIFIGDLNNQIPNNLKSKVYCMHFNDDKCIELAENMGFNVVKVISNKKLLSQ